MIYNLASAMERKKAELRFAELLEERAKIELIKKEKRSLSQNNYLYLLINYFAAETGYTAFEAKQIYKEVNSQIYEYEKNGKKFIRSSADLTTTELSYSIDRFRNYSSTEASVYLPSAGEKEFLEECEREIAKNKFI